MTPLDCQAAFEQQLPHQNIICLQCVRLSCPFDSYKDLKMKEYFLRTEYKCIVKILFCSKEFSIAAPV